jgi:asparagine synthase (glutamine-hydrolysing)
VAAEAGVDTLFGGDGGDEIFGGNERYAKNLLFEYYGKIPQFLRKRMLEPVVDHLNEIPLMYWAGRYIRRSNIPNPDRFYSYNLLYENDADAIFNRDFLSQIDESCFLNMARHHYRQASATHVTDKLLYLDMKFTITDNDLRKVTQMAEAAGVSVRYPLLDLDLVNFAATIPPSLKVKLGKDRYIFKRAMQGFLPEEIIKKKKHGMGLPIANWFRTDSNLAQFLGDNLFAEGARIKQYIRSDFIETMRREFQKDETPYYGSNLWVFLILELWLRKNGN